MTEDEKEFIKKVNIDKADNKFTATAILIVVSLLTYVLPLIYGEFDFGIIFESISLVFLLIAKTYITSYDDIRARRYIMCSIVAISILLMYDFIFLFLTIRTPFDILLLGYDYIWSECLTIGYIIMLCAMNRDLLKARNPVKYKESTDWFYEKYEEKEKK